MLLYLLRRRAHRMQQTEYMTPPPRDLQPSLADLDLVHGCPQCALELSQDNDVTPKQRDATAAGACRVVRLGKEYQQVPVTSPCDVVTLSRKTDTARTGKRPKYV